ncbi:MAG: HAD-IB family phosphatase [Eubacteriales bacterium]|nr:HAD-IB family phosphatase [Eubacteriales bacterium]
MNAYDFDKTIYPKDSSAEFFGFCLKSYPLAVLRAFPGIISRYIAFKTRQGTFLELKEQVFSFLKYVPDIDSAVELFWQERKNNIGEWYLKRKKSDDVIISASPEFLLRPVSEMLGVELIATVMDKRTGEISGLNCHDKEKVRRFRERYPEGRIAEFYSDSYADTPLAQAAEKAFMVGKGKIDPWKNKK